MTKTGKKGDIRFIIYELSKSVTQHFNITFISEQPVSFSPGDFLYNPEFLKVFERYGER